MTIQELQTEIQRIQSENTADTQYQDFQGQDLQGQDFTGKDLTGSNFRNANLENVNFSGAILTYANFKEANMTNVTISAETISYGCPWIDALLADFATTNNTKPQWRKDLDVLEQELFTAEQASQA